MPWTRRVVAALAALILCALSVQARTQAPAQAAVTGYLHTSGSQIVDANNNPVVLTGSNWFGGETNLYIPYGLNVTGYRSTLDHMKALSFNTVRLPYSNEALRPGAVVSPLTIDFSQNPDLVGLSPVQVLDKIIGYAGQIGMRVILERHQPDTSGPTGVWYSGQYSESTWIRDWVMLAQRYASNPAVFAMDLHNEPNGAACWACADLSRDWRLAAERAGNAILAVNPQLLILVEGTDSFNGQGFNWWGGNLQGVASYPVRLNVPNRVVYSPHEYADSVFPQPWFNDPAFPANLAPDRWDPQWGYIQKNNIAPVLLGGFGSTLVPTVDQQWLRTLMAYLGANHISFTYSAWNPNSADTLGLTTDFINIDTVRYNYLRPYLTGIE